MPSLEQLLAKVAVAPGLLSRLGQGFQKLPPMAQHGLMGAGIGLGGSLLAGADPQGQTHHLRNMAVGAGAGAAAGHFASRSPAAPAMPASTTPKFLQGHTQQGAIFTPPKVAAAYEAGKAAAFKEFAGWADVLGRGALLGVLPGAIGGAIQGGEGHRLEGAARGGLGGAAGGAIGGGLGLLAGGAAGRGIGRQLEESPMRSVESRPGRYHQVLDDYMNGRNNGAFLGGHLTGQNVGAVGGSLLGSILGGQIAGSGADDPSRIDHLRRAVTG